MAQIKVTQVRSSIGTKPKQRGTQGGAEDMQAIPARTGNPRADFLRVVIPIPS